MIRVKHAQLRNVPQNLTQRNLFYLHRGEGEKKTKREACFIKLNKGADTLLLQWSAQNSCYFSPKHRHISSPISNLELKQVLVFVIAD